MRLLTSAGLGIPLTLLALIFSTTGMLGAEVGADHRLTRWMSSTGLVLTAAAVAVIITRFAVLAT